MSDIAAPFQQAVLECTHLRRATRAFVPLRKQKPVRKINHACLLVFAAISCALFSVQSLAAGLQDGINYLNATQQADGSWMASADTAGYDTAIVAETLGLLGQRGPTYDAGTGAVVGRAHRNLDELARKTTAVADVRNVGLFIAEMLASQSAPVSQPTSPDYPGGGWGIAPGYGTSVIDTALVVRALESAGFGRGLAVVADTVPAPIGARSTARSVTIPANASNITLTAHAATGQVQFILTQPGGASFTAQVGPGSVPTNIGPFPPAAGEWTMEVENLTNAEVTFSAEVSFTDADGVSSRDFTRPLIYLGLAQNSDGGWGVNADADSLILATAEVVRALSGNPYVFTGREAQAAAWLVSKQNVDGGFSTDPAASNTAETALALRAIGQSDSNVALNAGIDYLQTLQLANGSWGNSPLLTALALQALLIDEPREAPAITSDGGAGAGVNYTTNASVAIITGTLPVGTVDLFVSQPNAVVELDLAAGTFTITLDLDIGVNGLTLAAIDGFGQQGVSSNIAVTRDIALVNQTLTVQAGTNLLGLRIVPDAALTAQSLLEGLGNAATRISLYNTATQMFESLERNGNGFDGPNFALSALDGFVVEASGAASTELLGGLGVPQTVDLAAGLNLLTIPNPPAGMRARDLLLLLGDEATVSTLQSYNPTARAFDAMSYIQGNPQGNNFEIRSGVAYQVFMRTAVAGFELPASTQATIQINEPLDGTTVTTATIDVIGDVSGTQPLTVTVNGIAAQVVGGSFSATVPLVEGVNDLVANLTDAAQRSASDTVQVTFEAVDFSIAAGTGVSSSRDFTGDSTILDQIAFFTENIGPLPPGVNYIRTSVARVGPTTMRVEFQITVDAGTPPGFSEFQVEYGLLDVNQVALGPLQGNLFDFRIEVTP